jgi:ribosomal subunit interface protein
MDIELQSRNVDVQPGWRVTIADRLARLAGRHPRLLRVHVTLDHGRHHRSGTERVAVVANAAGTAFRVEKRGERMEDAIHAALDALEHALAARAERRRDAARLRAAAAR